jgi:hypothetical protein
MTDQERTVRAALEAAASRVDVAPDALSTIRRRVGVRARRRRVLTVSLAAAAVTAVVASGVAVAVGRGSPVAPPVPGESSTVAPAPPTVDTPSPTGVGVEVPVYFVGNGSRTGLYREFLPITVAADTLADAIGGAADLALSGKARDPDYASAWPSGFSVKSSTVDGDVSVLDLTGPGLVPADPPAVQQIVYTATAVAADRTIQLAGVRLSVNGVSVPGGDIVRAPALETLAPLWLMSPHYGEVVSQSFDVQVAGAVFEATARVRVRDSGGAIVDDRVLTLSIGAPSRGTGTLHLMLAPGRYTIEVFYVSQFDSSEKGLDDHDITVT